MKMLVRTLVPLALIAFAACGEEPGKAPQPNLPANAAGGVNQPVSSNAGVPGPFGGGGDGGAQQVQSVGPDGSVSDQGGSRPSAPDPAPTRKMIGANGVDSTRPTPPVDPNQKIPPPPNNPKPAYSPTGWTSFDNCYAALTDFVDASVADPYSNQTAAFGKFVKMVDIMQADRSKSGTELDQLRKDFKQLVHETYNMYRKEVQYSDRMQMLRGIVDYMSSVMDRGVGPHGGQLERIGYMVTLIDYWSTVLRLKGV